ncbi:MAG: hypothetical protein ACRD9Q_05145 [Nitrososphaeraceae archaeon]
MDTPATNYIITMLADRCIDLEKQLAEWKKSKESEIAFPDESEIITEYFAQDKQPEDISHSVLVSLLQQKGVFSIGQAEHLIRDALRTGFIYEWKTGLYKKT